MSWVRYFIRSRPETRAHSLAVDYRPSRDVYRIDSTNIAGVLSEIWRVESARHTGRNVADGPIQIAEISVGSRYDHRATDIAVIDQLNMWTGGSPARIQFLLYYSDAAS